MKILVIGGSYFYGRVFTMITAEKYQLTLWNRGTYSMKEFGVEELVGERKNSKLLHRLRKSDFDAVVDFCAYDGEDVSSLIEELPKSVKQYILISTVDVYQRGTGKIHREDSPYQAEMIVDDAGKYIQGKIAAEKACITKCEEQKISYTILRPAILYGPYNYAPRESAWIQVAMENQLVPKLIDATGEFQFVYVKDAAIAIEKSLGNQAAFNKKINLCNDVLNYQIFSEELVKASGFPLAEMTVNQAEAVGLPLPFPVYKEETEQSDGTLSREILGMEYTAIEQGMKKTYDAFYQVYR